MKKSVFFKVACIALVTVGIITLNSCTKENIENEFHEQWCLKKREQCTLKKHFLHIRNYTNDL